MVAWPICSCRRTIRHASPPMLKNILEAITSARHLHASWSTTTAAQDAMVHSMIVRQTFGCSSGNDTHSYRMGQLYMHVTSRRKSKMCCRPFDYVHVRLKQTGAGCSWWLRNQGDHPESHEQPRLQGTSIENLHGGRCMCRRMMIWNMLQLQ